MKRLFPAPLLSFALLLLWLLLNQSLSLGHVLLGLAVAIAMPLLTGLLRQAATPVRRPIAILRLSLRVAVDVVLSALNVARGVARVGRRTPRGQFVVIPLDLRNPHALAALAIITTIVPGTVWSELAPDRSALLLHVFDLDEEDAFVAHFKFRYERPLQEIFE